LPQRREDEEEGDAEEGGEGGELRGAGGLLLGVGKSCGWWWRWRVGVLVTADAGKSLVALLSLRAAEVAVAHVLAALVVTAGQGGQLAEVLSLAAPLAVAAGPGWAVRFAVL